MEGLLLNSKGAAYLATKQGLSWYNKLHMRLLKGSELAGYIKERQAKQVRGLRQADHISPRLAIMLTGDNPGSVRYTQMKKEYGADILIDVVIERVAAKDAQAAVERHNNDPATHGIIVQLPLEDPAYTDAVVTAVAPEKDVDGLGSTQFFDPATPLAILWLIAGYNVSLERKKIVIIGKGRLVGAPLVTMLQSSGIEPIVVTREDNLKERIKDAEVIITATGTPGLLTSDLIPKNCVVVDAGVAGEGGVLKGDVDPEVYTMRDDLTITPKIGGVGPLTVCALFDNVIRSARRVASEAQ
jgi:methylenetetrahydrofolate dehydrogenase (NADP+)/methenyltetrahydrofolate cyclohydrolase